nr:cohesin subunit psc3-like [Leptinotarsa decemlineata]
MASPSKRLRLSPRSSQSLRTTQDTQDSKITSTPIRSSGNFHSPDISSISSSRTVRTRLSDVFEAEDNREVFESSSISAKEKDARSLTPATTVSEVSYIPVEEDYDAYFNNLGRIKYVGTVWKLYKPVNEHSLYHKILDDPLSIQEIVTKLFLKFNEKPEKVVHSLIQLCLDVANFQNFDVTKYYKFRENSEKEIIALLETDEVIDDHEILKSSGRYLFMESRSSLVKTMKMAIYNFFKKLILASYDNNVLFNKFFSKNLFNFIKCMSFSNMMVLRHTGVIIAMKILTALVIIYNNIIHRLNNSSSSGSVESEKIDRESQRKVFNSLIEYFYFIVIKNCRLQENRLLLMRIECIHEFQVWVKYFPKIFISELQVCTCLNRLIIDSSKDVRYAALEAFERFIESPTIIEFLKPNISEFIEVISKRFYDIDYKVSVKAIDIFTILLQSNENFVSTHHFQLITNLVFDKIFHVAEAAARFLKKFLQVQEYSSECILEKLAKMSLLPNDCSKQLVVESFLNCCSEMQNWQLYLKLLLGKEIQDLKMREALAEMLAEAIHQILIGKSTKQRTFSRKGK